MNWFQKLKKWIVTFYRKHQTVLLYIAVLVLIFIVVVRRPKEIIPPVDNTEPLLEKVKILEDKNNKQSAVITQYIVDLAQGKIYSDSLAKALKIKPKFIKGVDKLVYKTDTVIKNKNVYIPIGDTSCLVEQHDNYLDLVAVQTPSGQSIHLSLRDTVTHTTVTKRKGFLSLGRKETTVIVRNANPYVGIPQEAYSWKIKEKTPWFVAGPSIGYDPINRRLIYGISGTLPLIKLNR